MSAPEPNHVRPPGGLAELAKNWRQLGPNTARVLRLARKELTEILSDRRTILTLVMMPLLLYPLLSLSFRQFLVAFVKTEDTAKEYRVGVKTDGVKQSLQRHLMWGAEVEPWRAEKIIIFNTFSTSIGPPLPHSAAMLLAGRPYHEPVVEPPLRDRPPFGFSRRLPLKIEIIDDPHMALAHRDIHVWVDVHYAGEKVEGEWVRQEGEPAKPKLMDWHIYYLDPLPRSREIASYLEQRCALANARKLHASLARGGVEQYAYPIRAVRKPLVADVSGPDLSLAALVPLILILMTITGAVYPAIDLTAGERERGTLEILVAAPVPRLALLFSKYLAVVAVAVLTATINLAMMLVTLELTGLTHQVFQETGVTIELAVQLLFLLVLFAAFFSALLLALTSFARSFKEAQAYLIPLMLVSLSPGVIGMMPGLQLRGILAITPLLNIVLLARDLSEGRANLLVGSIVVGSTLAYALAAITAAARVFGAEAVLFSEQSGWSDLFRRPSIPRATASIPGALLCLALLLPVYYVLAEVTAHATEKMRLFLQIMGTFLMFVALPLAACLWARLRLASAFQLSLPSWTAWPAALLIGGASVPLIYQLGLWLSDSGFVFYTKEILERVRQAIPLRGNSPWARSMAMTVVAIAIGEELFFRGFLLSSLRANAGKTAAIAGSAALFGVFHFVSYFDRLVPSFLMGLILGWVAWQSRSVLPGMLLHATYNLAMYTFLTLQGTGGFMETSPPKMPLWWQLAAWPWAAGGVILLWFGSPRAPSASKSPNGQDLAEAEGQSRQVEPAANPHEK